MAKPKVLGVITARGGSKGIPFKNKRVFAGKPLIWYTFQSAKTSKFLSKIVLSTDDVDMLAMAKRQGIHQIVRPTELASDTATSLDVLKHAVLYSQNKLKFTPDLIVTLQPTSPMRTGKDIDACITLQQKTKADSVVSVSLSEPHPRWLFRIVDDKKGVQTLQPFLPGDYYSTTRRQDFEKLYKLNGAVVYVTTYDLLMKQNKILGGVTVPYVMENWISFDLDHPAEWMVGELTLKHEKQIRVGIHNILKERAAIEKKAMPRKN